MTYLEHLGLYCVVPAISMFYSESIKTKIAKKMTLVLAIYGFLFTLILSILQRMNVVHISEFLVAFHMYSAVFCIITLTFLFRGFREKAKSEKIICIGTMLLIVGGAIALVSYNMVKFADEGIRQNLNILPIATTSFITIMMISYIEYLKEMVEESVDKKVLLNMAYNDILTGLANRGKCDSVLEELDEEKRDNYGIICLDLNNLKVINDTKGHLVGDNYICQFADILEYSFGEDGTVGRIGGDEFIVIIKDILNIDIKKRMTEMLFLAESNTDDKGREFPISFAYGYVTGAEDGIMSAEEACELADKRMYKCKENQKAGRK